MHYAALMGRFDGFDDLPRNRQRRCDRYSPLSDPISESRSLDKLEHQSAYGVRFFEPKDCGDIWMIQGGEQLGFATKPSQTISISAKQLRQNLQSDVSAKFRVVGAINFAHASSSENASDFVETNACPHRQGHVRSLIEKSARL